MAEHLKAGANAEALAQNFLRKQGFKVLDTNVRCKFGEIDLIAVDGKTLVFVEVRLRTHTQFGSAVETVTIHKQRKLIKTAQWYLASHPRWQQAFMRFDVIGIDANQQLTWIKEAFQSHS